MDIFLLTAHMIALPNFSLWIKAKLLCYCIHLFDAIIELHAMDEEMCNDFLSRSERTFSM